MSEDIRITLVPKDYVHQVWDHVEGYLEDAVALTDGRYTVDDALQLVMFHNYILWVAFDRDVIKGAVITGFIQYPKRKVLHIQFLGGVEGRSWKDAMLHTLQRFARDSQCACVEAAGPDAWGRVLQNDGFKPLWQTFELPIAGD